MATTYKVRVDGLQGSIDAGHGINNTSDVTLYSAALAGAAGNPGCPTIAAPFVVRGTFYHQLASTAIDIREDFEITAYTAAAASCTINRGLNGTSKQTWGDGSLWVASFEVEDLNDLISLISVTLRRSTR